MTKLALHDRGAAATLNLMMPPLRRTLSIALALSLATPSHALFGWGEKKAPEPLGAVLADINGPVTVKRASGNEFVKAVLQTELETGDTVKTGAGGRAQGASSSSSSRGPSAAAQPHPGYDADQ